MAGGAGDFGGGAGNGGVNPNGHYDGGGSGDTGGTDPVPYPDIGGDGDDYGSGADIKDVRLDADSVDTSAGGDEPGVGGAGQGEDAVEAGEALEVRHASRRVRDRMVQSTNTAAMVSARRIRST